MTITHRWLQREGRASAALAVVLALAAAVAGAQPAPPKEVDPALIPNYTLIRPGLAAAGQPSREGLAALPGLGFRTVVSLRREGENGIADGERELIEKSGLRFVQVPVTAATLSQADVDAVARVLEDPAAGPVLLHCGSASRVGAVWMVLEGRKGRPLAEVQAEAEAIGMKGAALREAALKLLAAKP